MKRIVITIVAVGLVVPAVAVASRVATGSTRTAIVPRASEASRAGVHIYWTNSVGTSRHSDIGRAKLNGTAVDRRFIPVREAVAP